MFSVTGIYSETTPALGRLNLLAIHASTRLPDPMVTHLPADSKHRDFRLVFEMRMPKGMHSGVGAWLGGGTLDIKH